MDIMTTIYRVTNLVSGEEFFTKDVNKILQLTGFMSRHFREMTPCEVFKIQDYEVKCMLVEPNSVELR